MVTSGYFLNSCNQNDRNSEAKEVAENHGKNTMMNRIQIENDSRISLNLNPMQKEHQLMNMRSHLEAVQNIISLLSDEKYDVASKVAYTKLGSTTEMQLMCSSFDNKAFEKLGMDFHKSADKMSEVFKNKIKRNH